VKSKSSATGRMDRMTSGELKAALALAGLYVLRMLGLFMILPVLALYTERLEGATPFLTGVAIGIYGLTQACLQIPLGMLSDRIGRKRIIIFGLSLFALGSGVAALANSIFWIIIGRALQGAGAIAAAVMALAADLSREEHRTKVMAMIGASIGASFALAMVLGPVLNSWVGIKGIFWITVLLALGGILMTCFVIPQPVQSRFHRDTMPVPMMFKRVLTDPQLVRLNFGILILHMLLTATFTAMPLALRDMAGLPASRHWELYLPVLVLSLAAVIPLIIVAEKHRRMKPIFLGAIIVLCLSELGLLDFHSGVLQIGILLVAFFTGFNLLESALPSLISKMSPADAKGTAMGIYSTSQFFGAFVGGALGGWTHQIFGLNGVFAFAALMALIWFFVAYTMKNPRYLSSYLLNIGTVSEAEARRLAFRLTQVRGVAEAVVIASDGVAYLKVDSHALDEAALRSFSVPGV
jgi:MFS family permease